MKKSNCSSNDIHQEGQEQSKKLYRSISESARRLDDAHSCANHVADLFTPALQIQRSRFQEYCERLIFSEPTLFGRKAEELLWRKAYYDVISAAKRLKKKEYTPHDICNIQTHINAGVGHYHHFISRLQYQFNFDLKTFVDFAILKMNLKKVVQKPEHIDWAKQSVHRSLIYLGDLNRYKLEIYPNCDSGLAVRYYLKAVHYKPEYGIPHNQMGTLASSQNRILDAVYHYICCLSCKHPFEGTENNLLRLFEKNSHVLEEFPIENGNADCIIQLDPPDHIKRLIARFLVLTETWFFNRKLSDIYILCHQTNVDLQECFLYTKPAPSESEMDADSVDTDSILPPSYLTEDMVFKIIIICLLCITKLQKLQLSQLSTTVAFTLAVYSQLLQIVTDHISDSLLNITMSDMPVQLNGVVKGQLKKQKKVRRRRKNYSSDDESEISDTEAVDDVDSNSEPSNNGSGDELEFSSSENDSEDEGVLKQEEKSKQTSNSKTDSENNSVNNGKSVSELIDKIKKVDPNTMLEIISEEKLLYSIKVLSDWFISDMEIVRSCGKSTRSLLNQIVQLLNLLNIDLDSRLTIKKCDIEMLKQEYSKIALPEDSALKGTEILRTAQNNLDWDYIYNKSLSLKEETIIRILKLISIGHSLAKVEETGVSFDEKKKQFTIHSIETEEVHGLDLVIDETNVNEVDNDTSTIKDGDKNENKGQLTKMKHMGQLWLAAEVRALENRVKGKTSFSPYLVVDVDALIQYTSMIKHLVNSKKFIIVVPSAVVSALDDLKKEKPEARDAIRWLELQFHHGNRFCRAQRPQERAPLPLIKYPKKKDKEMFTYIQIIECCHYLAEQQKDATNLVTLLLGNENALSNCENREISYTGLARSAGINLEHVKDFYEKWRKNYKSKK